MNIIILGPQGSGKGTQAEMLAEKFDLEHIDMGRYLRELAKLNTRFGKEVNEIVNIKKELISEKVMEKVLKLKLADLPREKGVIFDGAPRALGQAKYMEEVLLDFGRKVDKLVYIKISREESIKRISKRWICEECRAILIIGKSVKSEKDKCPKCGGKIIQRIDDTSEGINKRLDIFAKETMPVINYFKEKGLTVEINGEQSVKKVFGDILYELRN